LEDLSLYSHTNDETCLCDGLGDHFSRYYKSL